MKHRRRLPKILLGVIAFVLLVSVALGGFVWFKTAPPPRIDTVAALIEAREAIQPAGGGEDAWPRYVALYRDTLGMKRIGDRDASDLSRLYFAIGTPEFGMLTAGEWDDPRLDNAKAMLREAQPILEALRHATDAPACRAPIMRYDTLLTTMQNIPVESGDETTGGPLDGYAALSGRVFPPLILLLSFEARDAFESGDLQRYTDTIRRLFVIAEHVGSAPFALSQSGRADVEVMAYRNIGLLALEDEMTPEWVDAVLPILDEPARAMPLRDFLLETAEVSTNIEMRHLSRQMRAPTQWWRALLDTSPREIAARRLCSIEEVALVVDVPAAELASRGLSRNSLFIHQNRDILHVTRPRGRALSARAATRIILLLERHHALTGEWPASLEDIMPREDTLDPNTLTPFVYTLTPEGPFPFSLAAPPEATFIPEEDRDFTKPRRPIAVQNKGPRPRG